MCQARVLAIRNKILLERGLGLRPLKCGATRKDFRMGGLANKNLYIQITLTICIAPVHLTVSTYVRHFAHFHVSLTPFFKRILK